MDDEEGLVYISLDLLVDFDSHLREYRPFFALSSDNDLMEPSRVAKHLSCFLSSKSSSSSHWLPLK